ncbi:MAG: enoyl-CoA hydratase/isomerase family protein, partial [Ilumatobacteraceae bacterium]
MRVPLAEAEGLRLARGETLAEGELDDETDADGERLALGLGDTDGEWGLVPIWGMSVRLPERVGRSTAKELMFTSRRIGGVEAARIGLVDRCVPDDELDATVAALAAEIAANSAGPNRIVKRLLAAAEPL